VRLSGRAKVYLGDDNEGTATMITTAILQGLDVPPGAAIFRTEDKWDCEGAEQPLAPKPRFYTETKRINMVTEFYKRFPKTKDIKNEKFEFATLAGFF